MAKNKLTPQQIQVAFQRAYGRGASKTELNYWTNPNKGFDLGQLETRIGPDKVNRYVLNTETGKYDTPTPPIFGDANPPAGQNPVPVGKPDYAAQFAASAQGQQLAGQYSEPYLASTIDPYYNAQLGGEDYQKQLAIEQLGRNTQQTTENYGQTFNDRGLYGSGVYQTELQKSLGNLNRGYNEQYGAGQYTPFSLRKQQIEQNRQTARIGATQQGQTMYSGAYQDYLQGLST